MHSEYEWYKSYCQFHSCMALERMIGVKCTGLNVRFMFHFKPMCRSRTYRMWHVLLHALNGRDMFCYFYLKTLVWFHWNRTQLKRPGSGVPSLWIENYLKQLSVLVSFRHWILACYIYDALLFILPIKCKILTSKMSLFFVPTVSYFCKGVRAICSVCSAMSYETIPSGCLLPCIMCAEFFIVDLMTGDCRVLCLWQL